MPQVKPYHSTLLRGDGKDVYHIYQPECTEGNNIEERYFAHGTANRPLCSHCNRLYNS